MNKVSELSGDVLAEWVARALGYVVHEAEGVKYAVNGDVEGDGKFIGYIGGDDVPQFAPHTDWAQGGPIIDQCMMGFCAQPGGADGNGQWMAYCADEDKGWSAYGDSHLVAAMRCFAAYKFFDNDEFVSLLNQPSKSEAPYLQQFGRIKRLKNSINACFNGGDELKP